MAERRLTAGDLRHTVTVEAPVGVLHESEAVEIAARVPMKIEPLAPPFQTIEYQALGGLQSATRYIASSRYRTDISTAYVLKEQCCTRRTFQIVAIVPNAKTDALDMTCVTTN